MHLCRLVIRGFRNFTHLDVPVADKVTCVVGENNTGKTNLVFALRLALDAGLSSTYRNLTPDDFCSGTDSRFLFPRRPGGSREVLLECVSPMTIRGRL